MTDRKRKSLIALFTIIGLTALLYKSGVLEHFSLMAVKQKSAALKALVDLNYLPAVFVYIATYIVAITLALPIVMPIALLGGFLFNMLPALVYSSVGVLCGMLLSLALMRSILYPLAKKWLAGRLDNLKQVVAKYGANYFLMLYVISIVPSFVVSALAAVTEIPVTTFIWTTIVGNIPLLFICSLTGRQLASIRSLHDILSPQILISFALLGLLALLPIFFRRLKEQMGI